LVRFEEIDIAFIFQISITQSHQKNIALVKHDRG